MNYKKVITAILLISDGSVNHKYFLENFNISNEDLVNIFDDINDELKEKDYGFYIKYDGKSSDLVTLSEIFDLTIHHQCLITSSLQNLYLTCHQI